jgi:SAM-dependent methyltransferase
MSVGLYARPPRLPHPAPMSFDRLAPHYRWLERVLAGDVLQEGRVAHLVALDEAQNILLVGEGPGRFLAALRKRRPDVPITVLDSSPRMLAEARNIATGPTTFECLDLTSAPLPSAQWDAVVTHCFLDCFAPPTLNRVIDNLAQATTRPATWLITDFALPATGWRRPRARLVHALMYRTFRITANLEARHWTDPAPFLQQQGFNLQTRQAFNHGLIHADQWQRA